MSLDFLKDKHILVVGLGASGSAVFSFLKERGFEVKGYDDRNAEAFDLQDLAKWTDVAVLSPGIPYKCSEPHKLVSLLVEKGAQITGDMDLFYHAHQQGSFMGITGTNGKSTVTALLGHMLKGCGLENEVGGNIGANVIDLSDAPRYVLELSSYQIDLINDMQLDLGILTNITPDHLARHGGLDGYIAAKKRLFEKGRSKKTLIGIDSDLSKTVYDALLKEGVQNLYPVSQKQKCEKGLYLDGHFFVDGISGDRIDFSALKNHPYLKGEHNLENILLVFAAGRLEGCSAHDLIQNILTFKGLAHRQEYVGVYENVTVINDSKATNGISSAKALACYDNIYWILGGAPKEGGLEDALPFLKDVKKAYLIGASTDEFAKNLEGKVVFDKCYDLKTAFEKAMGDALQRGEKTTLLLSPACASFDQFKNFEMRGDAFKDLFMRFLKERKAS